MRDEATRERAHHGVCRRVRGEGRAPLPPPERARDDPEHRPRDGQGLAGEEQPRPGEHEHERGGGVEGEVPPALSRRGPGRRTRPRTPRGRAPSSRRRAPTRRSPERKATKAAPAEAGRDRRRRLADLEGQHLPAEQQRPRRDAAEVERHQHDLQRERDERALRASPHPDADRERRHGEVGGDRRRPAEGEPVEHVAHPQCGDAEEDERRARAARACRWRRRAPRPSAIPPSVTIHASASSLRRAATARAAAPRTVRSAAAAGGERSPNRPAASNSSGNPIEHRGRAVVPGARRRAGAPRDVRERRSRRPRMRARARRPRTPAPCPRR